ncbi:ankyrin repeat domain-containing protein [Ralstonia sp. ASV6]|uniref:ankyrin repeat domain-containing protein n=1 Tax=Ralstonia sp. ASV6 TaxID=2795124 RepID=UPI0018EDF5F1|nr:ankyrin repeat domain-containing protein [Ralstonia sp. ASV6]
MATRNLTTDLQDQLKHLGLSTSVRCDRDGRCTVGLEGDDRQPSNIPPLLDHLRLAGFIAESNSVPGAVDEFLVEIPAAPALTHAIATDRLELAKALIAHGADVNAVDASGRTALHFASRRNAVALLIAAGADINHASKDSGTTPLIEAVKRGRTEAVGALLSCRPDLDRYDASGFAATHYAATREPEVAYLLYKVGANFDLQNAEGETARAIFERHAQVRSLERTMQELESIFGPRAEALRATVTEQVAAAQETSRDAKIEALCEDGVAVYQVGNVFETDAEGKPIPDEDREKWFVSTLMDSPLAATGTKIPLAATEQEAWDLAIQHLTVDRAPEVARSTREHVSAYYGTIEAGSEERNFLASLNILPAAYDSSLRGFPVKVETHKAVDVIQYLSAFKYAFTLHAFDGGVPTMERSADNEKKLLAYTAHLRYEAATCTDPDRLADLHQELARSRATVTQTQLASATVVAPEATEEPSL